VVYGGEVNAELVVGGDLALGVALASAWSIAASTVSS
jgi:hypothetical protein